MVKSPAASDSVLAFDEVMSVSFSVSDLVLQERPQHKHAAMPSLLIFFIVSDLVYVFD